VQKSFLDAFLKNEDKLGWTEKGKLPPVDLVLRKGNVGFNNAEAEKAYERRNENEWPIARTIYTPYYLQVDGLLSESKPKASNTVLKKSYRALGTLKEPQLVQFTTDRFTEETEITGHVVAHLNVSVTPDPSGPTPSDIDLFVTLRYIAPSGEEVMYTGTAGDPIPLSKGWLRVSMRMTNEKHSKHRPWLPYREYLSTDVLPVIPGEAYACDVEVWPTNVIVEKGGRLVFEVSSGDTQGSGIFCHDDPTDRSEEKLRGVNHIHFGRSFVNYVTLPVIPPKM